MIAIDKIYFYVRTKMNRIEKNSKQKFHWKIYAKKIEKRNQQWKIEIV